MSRASFHERYFGRNYLKDRNQVVAKHRPEKSSLDSPETSPRILSMLRFEIFPHAINEIQKLADNWPFVTLEELVDFSRLGLIDCINFDQLGSYLSSWNGQPMNNDQAEADLTTNRVGYDHKNNNLYALIPISVQINGEEEFTQQDRYLLIHFEETVLSPGEPASTRIWLNALLKYYDFTGKKVAEVFSGSSPAAVVAAVQGASLVDSYELNPVAVDVALDNYDLYQVPGKVFKSDVWSSPKAVYPEEGYDLVLANPPFNPKPVSKRLPEAVHDLSYLSLAKFLVDLPQVLSKNGIAIVLYEDLPVSDDGKNAIQNIADSLNNNLYFSYKFDIKEKLRLRRFRGEGNPLTTYVIYEIGYEGK
jgi:methylase of polypeptide subunit release factors